MLDLIETAAEICSKPSLNVISISIERVQHFCVKGHKWQVSLLS